jgi:hypothetical protein
MIQLFKRYLVQFNTFKMKSGLYFIINLYGIFLDSMMIFLNKSLTKNIILHRINLYRYRDTATAFLSILLIFSFQIFF